MVARPSPRRRRAQESGIRRELAGGASEAVGLAAHRRRHHDQLMAGAMKMRDPLRDVRIRSCCRPGAAVLLDVSAMAAVIGATPAMRAHAAHSSRKASVAFVPPSRAIRQRGADFILRASFGKSRSQRGSRWNRLAVSGATWSRNASTVKTADPAGGAEQMSGHRFGRRDRQFRRMLAEAALDRDTPATSPSCVDVPCALM